MESSPDGPATDTPALGAAPPTGKAPDTALDVARGAAGDAAKAAKEVSTAAADAARAAASKASDAAKAAKEVGAAAADAARAAASKAGKAGAALLDTLPAFRATDLLRGVVSGRRRRYQQDGYDLDLTFITRRVIAMGFPSEGIVESSYRNSLDDVSKFLHHKFGATNFLILNLSERKYNYSRLHDAVVECGFPDLHTCPVDLALELAAKVQGFLDRGPRKVVLVHCLAGKGRTGVIVAAHLLCSLAVVRNDAWDYEKLAAGVPLAEVLVEEEVGGSGGGGGGAAPLVTPAGAPEDAEEAAAVEAAVPPEHELAARAIVAFKLLRGDGLNYNAQRKTVRYVAALVRGELVRALVRAGAGGALLRARAEGAPPPPLAYASALRALRPRLPPPPAPTVTIWNVVLHGVPRLRGSPRASGCAPSFQLRSLPHQHLASVSLYDSAWSHPPGEIPVYDQESECVIATLNAVLSGDVLLRVVHHPGQAGEGPSRLGAATASASSAVAAAWSGLGRGLSRLAAGAAATLRGLGKGGADGGAAEKGSTDKGGGEGGAADPGPAAADTAADAAGAPADAGAAAPLPSIEERDEEEGEEDTARDVDDAYDGAADEEGTAPVTGTGGPQVPTPFFAGKPSEIFRYSFHTGFLSMDQRWGVNVHRVFAADLDHDRRKKSPWRLPAGFFLDITYEVKTASSSP